MNITYPALLAAVEPTFVVLACGFALRRFHGLRPEADGSMLTVAVNFLYPCFIADTVLNSTALRDMRTVTVAPSQSRRSSHFRCSSRVSRAPRSLRKCCG